MNRYYFGSTSKKVLSTIHIDLAAVAHKALSYGVMDASAIQGRRNRASQNRYFQLGKSKVQWPDSKHNVYEPYELAKALDIVPYVNGKPSWNFYHCLVWSGLMLAAASELGVAIRWGGNWDMDGEPITDQDFQDLGHFEMVN